MRFAIVAAMLLVACRDPPREQPGPPPVASTVAKVDQPPPPEIDAGDKRPLTPEEQKAKKVYDDALAEGRSKTKSGDYDGAIAAFGRAIVAKPDDARALGERAYARIHIKDWDGARADIERALPTTDKPAVLGMLYYNLGLVFEGRGEPENARLAFARSNALHPTKDAKDKLAARSACTARIEKPGTKAIVVADAGAAWDTLVAAYKKRGYDPATLDPKPAGDAAIKKALCRAGCDGGPWVARLGSFVFVEHAVVPNGGKLALYDLADGVWGICGGSRKSTLATEGSFVHVHARDDVNVRRWVKSNMEPCESDKDECMSGCFPASHTDRDWFLDTTKEIVVAVVTQSAAFQEVKITQADGGVALEGGGCKESVTLR